MCLLTLGHTTGTRLSQGRCLSAFQILRCIQLSCARLARAAQVRAHNVPIHFLCLVVTRVARQLIQVCLNSVTIRSVQGYYHGIEHSRTLCSTFPGWKKRKGTEIVGIYGSKSVLCSSTRISTSSPPIAFSPTQIKPPENITLLVSSPLHSDINV